MDQGYTDPNGELKTFFDIISAVISNHVLILAVFQEQTFSLVVFDAEQALRSRFNPVAQTRSP